MTKTKKVYRYFAGFLKSQANWLNRMSADGYRLVRTGKLSYEFEPCAPGQYQYAVEFIAHMSHEKAEEYADFLRDCGCRVFFKNINLNWNVGKTEGRPWADKGGRIATNATTYNRELLIVEKKADGKPFRLHTTREDQIKQLKTMCRPWLFMLVVFGLLGLLLRSWVPLAFAAVALVVLLRSAWEIRKLGRAASLQEWEDGDENKDKEDKEDKEEKEDKKEREEP